MALFFLLWLAAPGGEWTLEEARGRWQPMIRPVAHVGVPGYPFQAAVLWDGGIVFGPLGFRELKVMQAEIAPLGDNRLHLSLGFGEPERSIDRRGSGDPAISRSLDEGRLPIPRVRIRAADLVWDETVFAHLLGPGDDVLVVHAILTATNAGRAARVGCMWLHFGDTSDIELGYKCVQKETISPSIPHRFDAPFGLVGEKVRYVIPPLSKGSLRESGSALRWEVSLAAGEEAALRIAIPYGLVDQETGRRIAALDADAKLDETRRAWRRIVHGPGRIITPDPFVNDYLAAIAGQMAEQVAFRSQSKVWMYKTSPNHYEGYWPCNAAKALPTFDLRGLTGLSRPVLQSFVEAQTDDVRGMDRGALGRDEKLPGEGYAKIHGFLGNFGEWTANPLVLSHGLALWALATHYRITRDDAWLGAGRGSPLQAVLDGFDWVAAQRRRTMREVDGVKVAHHGLLPAASAHDWLAGNTIFNDGFCIYGMAEVVRLLRETKHPRADACARELADHRACLRDRYREARDRARRVPLADGTSIPYVPRIVQELDWTKPDWTYTGYGPLRAGALGALDPHDELVDQTLAFLEAGMPKGEGPYFSAHAAALAEAAGRRPTADANWADVSDPAAERHYAWRHYVEYETMWPIGGPLFLARDDLPRFFEWLFHNLAVVLHAEWRVGVESLDGVPSCAPGDGERWQCIRKMFVHERGGYDGSAQSLWLLQAIPRSWLRPGDRLSVGDMGTTFGGKVDLEVDVARDGESVAIDVWWRDLAVLPEAIVMRIRSGDGRPVRSAEIDGVATPILESDTIRLPIGASARHRIVGRFRD